MRASFVLIRMYSIVFLTFFLAGYYISFRQGDTNFAGTRISLAIGIVLLILCHQSIRNALLFFKIDSVVKLFLFLFIGYLALNTVVFLDWQSLRRLVSIVLFCWFLYLCCSNAYFRRDILSWVLWIPLLSILVSVAFLSSYYMNHGLSVPYKIAAIFNTEFSYIVNYENSIVAGLFISYLIPFCLYAYFSTSSKVKLVVYYLSVYLALAVLFITFARTAWLATLTIMLIFFAVSIYRGSFKKVIALYFPLILCAIAYLYLYMGADLQRGVTHRDYIWVNVIENIEGWKEWLIGKGLNERLDFVKLPYGAIAIHPHNIYIEMLYTTGLVGVSLLCLLLISILYQGFKVILLEENIIWVTLLSGLSVSMFFDFSKLVSSPNIMWLWFWFPIAMLVSTKKLD